VRFAGLLTTNGAVALVAAETAAMAAKSVVKVSVAENILIASGAGRWRKRRLVD